MNTLNQQPATTDQELSLHWPTVLQFGFSLFAILTLWGLAFSLLLVVFTSILIENTTDTVAILLSSMGLITAGVVLIPSAAYSFLRLLKRPSRWKPKLKAIGWLVFLFPVVVLGGHFAAQQEISALVFLPFLHVAAICISVFFLLLIGKRGISVGSPQRAWGVFAGGLVLAPLFSLMAEILLFLAAAILAGIYLARDPILFERLVQLSEQFQLAPESPEAVLELLEPMLMQPSLIYGMLLFGAVLIPLLEEVFKPVGVWFLLGRAPTPAQGFAAGLLSGTGYALFENFALSAVSAEEWSLITLARMGTSLMHILTTGISGYALVLAWRERRFVRLGLAYFLVVAIHGLWNGLVIINALPKLASSGLAFPQILKDVGVIAPAALIFLVIGSLVVLLIANSGFRSSLQ